MQQKHIWLMQPPVGPNRLHRMTWLVVCLAAINAMDKGRKAANDLQRRLHIEQSRRAVANRPVAPPALPDDQPAIEQFYQPAPLSDAQQQHNQVVQQHRQQRLAEQQQELEQWWQQEAVRMCSEAKQLAVAEFWKLLADFVIMHPCAVRAFESLPRDHPFLCVDDTSSFVQLAPRHE
jgi:FtsZ-interacting cell division protein ZipA